MFHIIVNAVPADGQVPLHSTVVTKFEAFVVYKQEGHFDGSVQDCSISIANALEILRSWTKPSILRCVYWSLQVFRCIRQHVYQGSWWRHQMETFPRYWPFVRGIHRSCFLWSAPEQTVEQTIETGDFRRSFWRHYNVWLVGCHNAEYELRSDPFISI